MMKPTAYLINPARGPIVDEKALVEALRSRTIAGAALDVFEEEPKLAPGLAELDNVVLAPHIASATTETRTKMAIMAAENPRGPPQSAAQARRQPRGAAMNRPPWCSRSTSGPLPAKSSSLTKTGAPLSQANHEYPISYPRPLWAEQDPMDWWKAAVAATRDCLSRVDEADRRRIVAIGLSSQRETMAAIDRQGEPLGNAILWMDRRSREQAEAISRSFGKETIHRRTGMLPDATFSLTKLMWLSQNDADRVRQTHLFLQPKEFVGFRMTKVAATEPSWLRGR